MRVTHRMMLDNAVRYMDENLERLYALQQRGSSGKNIQEISDDPATAQAILKLRSNLQTAQGHLDTASTSLTWMEANEHALAQLVDIATRAQLLVTDGLSDTEGATERQALADEIDSLLQSAVNTANSSHQGNYLFSGFKTNTKPFTLVSGSPDSVNYSGDAGIIRRTIGPGQTITVNIDGPTNFSMLFSALVDARDALSANDTAAAGVARSSLVTALGRISEARTTNGARQRQLNESIERMEKTQLALKSLLSEKEDADLAEIITEIRHQETIYQSVLETGRRVLNTPTLFDYLG